MLSRRFFAESLEQNKNDPKSLWKTLKSLGLPSKTGPNSQSNITLKINEQVTFDKTCISEAFNSFYTTVASKLVEKTSAHVDKFGKDFVNKFLLR